MIQPLWNSLAVPQKLNKALPHDPGIDPKELKKVLKYLSQMLIAALFTIIKRWKQPKCSLMDEWLNKNVVYIHNGILFSH